MKNGRYGVAVPFAASLTSLPFVRAAALTGSHSGGTAPRFFQTAHGSAPAAADTTGVSRRRVARNAVNCPSLRLLAPSRAHDDNGNVSSASHAWDCRQW